MDNPTFIKIPLVTDKEYAGSVISVLNYNDSNNSTGYRFWDGKTNQSYFGSEDETIIQRGTSYAITKIKRNNNGRIEFECAVVGQKY